MTDHIALWIGEIAASTLAIVLTLVLFADVLRKGRAAAAVGLHWTACAAAWLVYAGLRFAAA
ncbi:MAG: hypothetical protein AB7S26_19330 [Sandaracinaceae bacterium]